MDVHFHFRPVSCHNDKEGQIPNRAEYKVCVVLPRAPCRVDSPVPRGPPSGHPYGAYPFVTDSCEGMLSAAAGIEPLAAEGNGFGVASRPKETAALPWNPSRKGLSAPFAIHGQGCSRPEPRPVCRHRLRAKGRCLLSLCKPIDRGMALPGTLAIGARAMAAAASRSRLCVRVESARIGAN